MKSTMSVFVALFFLELFTLATMINVSFCTGSSYVGCIDSEREALLKLKQDLKDPSNRLASWAVDGDCCKWTGVVCSNLTGHVLQLRLQNPFNSIESFTGTRSSIERYFSENAAYSRLMLGGKINPALVDLKHLIHLDLSGNDFQGIQIPKYLGSLENLRFLNLSAAGFSGMIPYQLGNLSNLQYLDLSDIGHSELHVDKFSWMSGLSLLEYLDLSGVNLSKATDWLLVNPNWVPPFQLHILRLRSCHLGPQFPSWLRSQKHLSFLDISNTRISDTIPSWFWNSISLYLYLNLSANHIYGEIPNIDRRPRYLVNRLFVWTVLDLSNNALSGSISRLICDGTSYAYLSLSKNSFSGDIPDCWTVLPLLRVLNLGKNNFSGRLPPSIGTLSYLRSLNLRSNRLSGTIPTSIQNCSNLEVLDIGENEFIGNIRTWMGEGFLALRILNLRSNKFHGSFANSFCRIKFLQILDVACNSLSGTIPRCINNFTLMAATSLYDPDNATSFIWGQTITIMWDGGRTRIQEDASIVMKGFMVEYNSILNMVRSIDFSKNNFSGEIPMELTNLKGLQSLNFSHNFFTGKIPENIGNMSSIESLDFSMNQLSGKIPQSMLSLSFLSHLNLSDNNLTGKIPSSTQLQSFDASSFAGNNLCGAPLPDCTEKNAFVPEDGDGEGNGNEAEDEDKVDWLLYASMALGFVVGFWCFIGPLLVNRRWRYRYCNFLDCFLDRVGCFVRNIY